MKIQTLGDGIGSGCLEGQFAPSAVVCRVASIVCWSVPPCRLLRPEVDPYSDFLTVPVFRSSSPPSSCPAQPCHAVVCCAVQDLDSDALRRELIKDHIEALKRRRADEEKRQKEAAVSAFKELLERSNLKASSSWRKVQTKIQDTEEYEVRVGCGAGVVWVCCM